MRPCAVCGQPFYFVMVAACQDCCSKSTKQINQAHLNGWAWTYLYNQIREIGEDMEWIFYDFVFSFFGGKSNNPIAKAMRWIAYKLPDSHLRGWYWIGEERAYCCKDCSRFTKQINHAHLQAS